MASSSSSSATPQVEFHVFLSFRGEDTRNNFTSHLYAALERKAIKTFIDYQLPRGDEISSSLLDTIKASKISVIIFSENYAGSRWCLQELEQILDCRVKNEQIVIPVFHHVDLTDVRKQTGSFGGAFAKLQDRFEAKMQTWKTALEGAANLSGHVINKEKSESVIIENIVNDILNKLKKSSSYDEDLVGVQSRIEEIVSLLQIESDGVRCIGIWGIGGIGKTTICDAVFNKIRGHFECCYFAKNVREKSERSSELTNLQKELFSAILDDEQADIRQSFTKERLRRKKLLIVLDDVTLFEQIEKVIGDPNYLGLGSRIIVTTRDKSVIESYGMNDKHIYEVKGLHGGDSLQLFSKHAFGKIYPPEEYLKLSSRMISYAKGVPLALKVLGSFLHGETEQFWESAMKKLDKCLHNDIQGVLEISYDGLDNYDRKIFLDVACFFKDWESDLVKEILDACGFFPEIGLRNLIDKCLITISNGTISMHDLLQEMGRTIVRKDCDDPGKYSRLWEHEDIYNVLNKNSGTEAVESISFDISYLSKIRSIKLEHHTFAKMHNLRLLRVYNSQDQDDYQNKLLGFEDLEPFSKKLTYFSWDRYPFKSLPPNFHAENLVTLHMPNSKVEQLWESVQNLVKLKYIDLRNSRHLTSIPNLSEATNLQELILRDCKSLKSLPAGIQSKFITLEGCTNLMMVPMILCRVEHVDLSGTAIKESPFIEQPSKLVTLNLSNCPRLEILSNSICKCKYLEYLYLERPSRPGRLPDDFGDLEASETVISHGNVISKTISSIVHLAKRQRTGNRALDSLSRVFVHPGLACRQIRKLPEDLGQLSFLKELNLSGNNFENLPASIKNLFNLSFLNISNCERLISLPELPRGINMAADNCLSLESISNSSFLFSPILRPQRVNFSNCFKLNLSEYLDKESRRDFCDGVCYPGNKIPEWFKFQSIGSSITLKLSPDWMNENVLGFNMCAVVAFPESYKVEEDYQVFCFCSMKSRNNEAEVYSWPLGAWSRHVLPRPDSIGSDHVFVGFVYDMSKTIRLWAPQDEVYDCNSEVLVLFSFDALNDLEVKKCGIHFLYDYDDCSSFMIFNKEVEDEQHSSSRL